MGQHQHGLSLVELMVGMAVGLLVTAIALAVLSLHLRESHALVTEARLMQELRTVTGLLSHELRRARNVTLTSNGVQFVHADSGETLAYRLQSGVIDMKIASGAWQAMTDANTLRITAWRISPTHHEITLAGFCSQACEADDANCPPRQVLRTVSLEVDVVATHNTTWRRSSQRTVQLRHDELVGACPA